MSSDKKIDIQEKEFSFFAEAFTRHGLPIPLVLLQRQLIVACHEFTS
jgi:hypothetical protein